MNNWLIKIRGYYYNSCTVAIIFFATYPCFHGRIQAITMYCMSKLMKQYIEVMSVRVCTVTK